MKSVTAPQRLRAPAGTQPAGDPESRGTRGPQGRCQPTLSVAEASSSLPTASRGAVPAFAGSVTAGPPPPATEAPVHPGVS